MLCAQLARYLNRNYWEKKQEEARKSPTPSAPAPLTEPAAPPVEGHAVPANALEVHCSQHSWPTVLFGGGPGTGRMTPSLSLSSSRLPSRSQTLSP